MGSGCERSMVLVRLEWLRYSRWYDSRDRLAEPVGHRRGTMGRACSYPDVTAFAAGEKPFAVDEVVSDDEAAAPHPDHLGDQGELVIHGRRWTVVGERSDRRILRMGGRAALPFRRRPGVRSR